MTTLKRFNSLLLVLLSVIEYGSSSVEVVGRAGENVTLPCKYDIKYNGLRSTCWGRGSISTYGCNNRIIYTYKYQVREATRVSSRYQLLGRLQDGDLSLTILNTTEEDAGQYECRVELRGYSDEKHHINLTIEKNTECSSNSTNVVGRAGENITLPCKYDIKESRAYIKESRVYTFSACWGRGSISTYGCNNEIISTYRRQVIERTRVSSRYQLLGRLEDGDFSLTILNTTEDDVGRYGCRVRFWWYPEEKHHINLTIEKNVKCDDAQYGKGLQGDRSSIGCDEGQEGNKTAVCKDGKWRLEEDSCILTKIKTLLIAKDLDEEKAPQFVANLSKAVQDDKTKIASSPATISAIVDILNTTANIFNASSTVSESIMQNVLNTVDVIIADDARESWKFLNGNQTQNASSELLGSLETLSEVLTGEFAIKSQGIQLNRTTFNNSFSANLNSSVVIDIPNNNNDNVFITTITFSTLNNVMPARNSSFDAGSNNVINSVPANTINAAVVLVKANASIQNVTLRFNKQNKFLTLNPQCVFWNFTLLDNRGAWDDEGCKFVSDINNIVTCSCNHLTSFSILMATDIPRPIRKALDIITYVGVGISMASLVICLIIEGYAWKVITKNSTAFMRHVSIVNIALSLLIANICFIIGDAIAKNPLENLVGPCSTATFFMHFFYLALFFWMLVLGLLIFYRTVMVFSHMSKSTMLAIGFSLGYGCPLIIAVITVAATAPVDGYIRKNNACWLNWKETKALLALVIPALTIVLINILIVIVVLFKIPRKRVGDMAQSDEKHTLVVIARCMIILTPLFGLTWSLGVGTMISPTNEGIHIAFAFFNSLQGFFILVFGMLLDSKIRSLLSRQTPTTSTTSNLTRSTTDGTPSVTEMNLIRRLHRKKYTYDVVKATNRSYNNEQQGVICKYLNQYHNL